LHLAVAVQKTAAAGVEGLVVLENDDSFFHGVEGQAAALQHAPSGGSSIAHTVEMSVDHVVRNGPGTAVNDHNRIGWQVQTPLKVAEISLALEKCRV
jgi:hypothetical protein